MERCIICKSGKRKKVFEENGVIFYRCLDCGHAYSSFRQDQDYDGYFGYEPIESDSFWFKEAHKEMYEDFGRLFLEKRRGRLLDVGCGMGYFLKFMEKYPEWEAFGCEISGSAADFAVNKLGIKNVKNGKLEEAGFTEGSFDLITLFDVIEHIPEPDSMINMAWNLLRDGGSVFIHTPNIDIQLPKARFKKWVFGMREDARYLEAKDHVNIYSKKSMGILLDKHGFKSIRFYHLKPIQSVAGEKGWIGLFVKNIWHRLSLFLDLSTGGRLNIDNLFVAAKKAG